MTIKKRSEVELEEFIHHSPFQRKGLELSPQVSTLVETVFESIPDLDSVYKMLTEDLSLGDRLEFGVIRRNLDLAEDRARQAHLLYESVKTERTRWSSEYDVTLTILRKEVISIMEMQKESKARTKTITEGDIESEIANTYPEEIKYYKHHLAQVKNLEEHLEKISQLWVSRCATLRVLLETTRR